MGLEALLPGGWLEEKIGRVSGIGLLIDGARSKYKYHCIPVLIEFKGFRLREPNLEAAIAKEFTDCGFPDSAAFTESALKGGDKLVPRQAYEGAHILRDADGAS